MRDQAPRRGLLQALYDRLHSFHHDQGGAVALLCFAALLILFMVGLVVYDGGMVARTKMDVQMAADSAAYSSAAVKARSMNIIAYGNIGKRTAAGIHNMFVFQPLMYFIWWAGQCSRCCCGWFCGCWTACLNCAGNLIAGLIPFKALIEFAKVVGRDDVERNMEQIGNFQRDLGQYSGYWALGEAMVRGFRNEAHAVGSFPEPRNQNFGQLPIRNSNDARGACLDPFITNSPTTLGTMMEWMANFENLRRRSTSRPSIARQGPREVVNPAWSFLGCLVFSPREGAPYILTSRNPKTDHSHWFQRSNTVITYRHMGNLSRELRQNYDAVVGTAQTEGQGFLSNFGGSGVWSTSRSEFYFPEESLPMMLSRGGGDAYVYLYHPGWLGKLRPLTLPGERPPSQYGEQLMSKGYKEAERLMFTRFDVLELMRDANMMGFAKDRMFGTKAFKGMDGQVNGKPATDGLGK